MPSTLDRSLLAIERETSALTLPESRHGYDEARRVFNSMFDRRPSAIVRPRQSSDIERIVSILVQDGHRFTIRGGGHSIAGTCVADGTVMLDMSLLRRVTFDETTGIASAEPGALWCDYDAVTTRFGVASTGGIVSHTGVAGLVLGGGLRWLMGLAGLGCDALVGVDCYSSAGHVEHLDEDDPDLQLFRGAGRSLGVATELRFRPIPIPSQITAGRATTPLESAAEMFHLTDTSSEGWPAWVTVSPALVNRDGRWIGILDFVSTESTEKTTEVVRRCLPSDHRIQIDQMPYCEAQRLLDTELRFGRRNYWKSVASDKMDLETCEHLVEHIQASPSPQSFVSVDVVHGAALREPVGGSSYRLRHKRYVILFNTIWIDPADDTRNIEWCSKGFAALTRDTGEDGTYSNYFSEDDVDSQPGSSVELDAAARDRWDIPGLL